MSDKPLIFLVGGARPNFMKIAPVWRQLTANIKLIDTKIVHTGQHYDYGMSQIFFEELGLPKPDFFLKAGSRLRGLQTTQILTRFEQLIIDNHPNLVVVVGDVDSTLGASLAAAKLNTPVAHIEAGLRSFDRNMPEETNRVLTDRISTLLFASEPVAIENLKREGLQKEQTYLVGNVMIDSLVYSLDKIKKKKTLERFGLSRGGYCVLTLHRPANVDAKENLYKIMAIIKEARKHVKKIVFPIHPRTAKNLRRFGLEKEFESISGLLITEPLGYFDFMNLVWHARCVLTDSGGIQEETTWLGIPCITMRETTERPLTKTEGTNQVTGLEIINVRNALDKAAVFNKSGYIPPKLWDGKAAERITKIIVEYLK